MVKHQWFSAGEHWTNRRLTHVRCVTKANRTDFLKNRVALYREQARNIFPPASSCKHAVLGVFSGPRQDFRWFLQLSAPFIYERKVTLWQLRSGFQILHSLVYTQTAISYPIQSILTSINRWPRLRDDCGEDGLWLFFLFHFRSPPPLILLLFPSLRLRGLLSPAVGWGGSMGWETGQNAVSSDLLFFGVADAYTLPDL